MNNNEEKMSSLIINKDYRKIKVVILFILILAGLVFCFIKMIPFKYYGTYIKYEYLDGEQHKNFFKISPVSIKMNYYNGDEIVVEKLKYQKRGEDLIVYVDDNEYYIIIDDNCLFMETSKDISFSKKYGDFYWNEKSDKADLYEIDSKAEEFEFILEEVVNSWSRETIYNAEDKDVSDSKFYIYSSDEESDKTDLNNYEIKLKAANGEFSLHFDRKSKNLKSVDFSGKVIETLYGSKDKDSMDVEDLYDCDSLLLASMYILGSKDIYELEENLDNLNTFNDLAHRTVVSFDFDDLFENETTDKTDSDRNIYSLNNERYDITYSNTKISSLYSFYGSVSWSITIK